MEGQSHHLHRKHRSLRLNNVACRSHHRLNHRNRRSLLNLVLNLQSLRNLSRLNDQSRNLLFVHPSLAMMIPLATATAILMETATVILILLIRTTMMIMNFSDSLAIVPIQITPSKTAVDVEP